MNEFLERIKAIKIYVGNKKIILFNVENASDDAKILKEFKHYGNKLEVKYEYLGKEFKATFCNVGYVIEWK